MLYEILFDRLTTVDCEIAARTPHKVSGDFNPIHINPYFADYANLPGTITHGMWSSAATCRFVETVVAKGHPERVLQYDVAFTGMVLPGDECAVTLKHISMHDGNMVIKIATKNQHGEKVIQGTAEEVGMGMDLYASSPAARAVWDGADAHLLAVYGFSIVDIVKNNPKEKTIHFGGIKGQAIRQRDMDMSYDVMDKDGNVKTLPLFADINARTPQYTATRACSTIYATQFAQIALVVTERAALEDMHSRGLVQRDTAFAGHSLGEYSALASIADVLPTSALVDIVFYRGITMQRAVERDAAGRSNYAIDSLVEIVHYNVEGQQYICAGELVALQSLSNVLNYLKSQNVDIAKLTGGSRLSSEVKLQSLSPPSTSPSTRVTSGPVSCRSVLTSRRRSTLHSSTPTSASITDPYELYEHVRLSEIGTSIGSSIGGVESTEKALKGRCDEKDVQASVLQETFINKTSGWTNLLLLPSSDPIKIPVGAECSLEIAGDALTGKAKAAILSGFDNIS
ncbi:hypothetical protein PENSPDRAFT_693887 [Peniophora sp. CONT]|nr:hypothetical protein PENSPDRAFT_693887 [Peniophora sp. CONT]